MRTERKGAWIKNSLRGGISIRKRILFSYIIIMATALTALGVYACLQTEKRIKSNMNDSMEIVLQNKCGNIVDEVEKCNVMLMNIVRNRSVYNALCEGYDTETGSGIWSGLSDVIEPTIESFLNGSRSVDAITVYAEDEGP